MSSCRSLEWKFLLISNGRYRILASRYQSQAQSNANAFLTDNPDDILYGVLFDIEGQEKAALDTAEGVGNGYIEVPVTVSGSDGNQREAYMYVAESSVIDDHLAPYTWYKQLVLEGARQHALPNDYVSQIDGIVAAQDPDRKRANRNAVISS